MSRKVEYKKDFKHLYIPKTEPEMIDVLEIPFFMINGSGDPNDEEFQKVIKALYSPEKLKTVLRFPVKKAND